MTRNRDEEFFSLTQERTTLLGLETKRGLGIHEAIDPFQIRTVHCRHCGFIPIPHRIGQKWNVECDCTKVIQSPQKKHYLAVFEWNHLNAEMISTQDIPVFDFGGRKLADLQKELFDTISWLKVAKRIACIELTIWKELGLSRPAQDHHWRLDCYLRWARLALTASRY